MPLSSPKARVLQHTREVNCIGYKREDGLLDIEGYLVDTKPYPFPNKDRGGVIYPNEPLHEIFARITVDFELNIIDAEASLEQTPYNYCKQATNTFKDLIGLKIGPGWRQNIRLKIGGSKGCTHLAELLGPMATTAFQTLVSLDIDKVSDSGGKDQEYNVPSTLLNSCFSYAESSPIVKDRISTKSKTT